MTVLEIDRARRVYGSGQLRVTALDGVSLRVKAGEFVAVMGPSGSGKLTLLRLAGGLDRPTSGRVLLIGRDLASLDETGLTSVLRRQVGFVFQQANLLAGLTAAENVALALELDGVKPKAALAGARGLLDSLGLGTAGGRFPGQLSGGEQQRVAIARAVAGRPVPAAGRRADRGPRRAHRRIGAEPAARALRSRLRARAGHAQRPARGLGRPGGVPGGWPAGRRDGPAG